MGRAPAGALTGPQQVTSFPLGQNASPFLPVPSLSFSCWLLGNCSIFANNWRRKIPWVPSLSSAALLET